MTTTETVKVRLFRVVRRHAHKDEPSYTPNDLEFRFSIECETSDKDGNSSELELPAGSISIYLPAERKDVPTVTEDDVSQAYRQAAEVFELAARFARQQVDRK